MQVRFPAEALAGVEDAVLVAEGVGDDGRLGEHQRPAIILMPLFRRLRRKRKKSAGCWREK